MAKTGPYIEREHHNLTVSPSIFRRAAEISSP